MERPHLANRHRNGSLFIPACGIASGTYPAQRAAQLNLVDALRFEGATTPAWAALDQRHYGSKSSGREKRGPTRIATKSRRSVVSTR
jgi:hypothetical protein